MIFISSYKTFKYTSSVALNGSVVILTRGQLILECKEWEENLLDEGETIYSILSSSATALKSKA